MNPKPLQGHRGHTYALDESGLVIRFSRYPKGPLDTRLVKHPKVQKADPAQQLTTNWYLRYKTSQGTWSWKVCGAAGEVEKSLANALRVLSLTGPSATPAMDAELERIKERQTLTIGTLLQRYLAAGCPRKGTLMPRTGASLAEYRGELASAAQWWGPRSVATTTTADVHAFAAWRRDQTLRRLTAGDNRITGDGSTAARHEIVAIAQVLRYAVQNGWITTNPLAEREALLRTREQTHAWQHQPASDEELHQLATRLLRHPATVVSGARCLYAALTGQRGGEHPHLRWDAGEDSPGHRFHTQLPGEPPREKLCVYREKNGTNPAVNVHPHLATFLSHWQAYTAARWPGSPWYFPRPTDPAQPADADQLGRDLGDAVQALALPPGRRPGLLLPTAHGLRAFFVTVCRDAGYTDAAIADLLGQGSGAAVVRKSYGDRRTVIGSGRRDWLPSPESGLRPAWELLPALTAELSSPATPLATPDFQAPLVTAVVMETQQQVTSGDTSHLLPAAQKPTLNPANHLPINATA